METVEGSGAARGSLAEGEIGEIEDLLGSENYLLRCNCYGYTSLHMHPVHRLHNNKSKL